MLLMEVIANQLIIIDTKVMKKSSNVRQTHKPTRNGILSRFVEASVEMPLDGLNGDCVVHYSGQYNNYKMIVPLMNGVREGKAVILHNGLPTLKRYYTNGVLTIDMNAFVVDCVRN